MDLRQMRAVLAVIDHGTFTAAADALGVSQPALSQTIRAIEAELGVELFVRGRTVHLTAAGEAFAGPARQAVRDAAVVEAAVGAVRGNEAGHLDVVCLPSLAAHPTAELVGRFRGAYPGVSVRLTEPDDPADVEARVRDGASEIGITELPVGTDGLRSVPLLVHDFVAVVPAALAASLPSERVSLRALVHRPLITTPVGTSTRRQVDEAFSEAGAVPTIAVETDHREAIVALVRAGAGIAVLPRPLAEAAASGDIVIRSITPRTTREIGILTRTSPLSPAAAAFLELAAPGTAVGRRRPRPRRRRA